jgi:transcriptional/translational regulatory protein YebC/TACO1
LGEIRSTLNQNGGKLAGEGAVAWMFDKKGVIAINPKSQNPIPKNEELEMVAIEAGADDVKWLGEIFEISTRPEDFEKIKKALEEKQIKIESASIDLVPKEEVELAEKDKAAVQRLFDALDDNDAVNEIYSNIKN